MLINYIKIAFRNMVRHKEYSFINVLGLTFGLTCCLLIALYIHHELSYDDFHKQADRIYRVVEDISVAGSRTSLASTTGAAGPALVHDFPEVLRVVRFNGATMLVSNGEKRFQENNIFFTDSTVFDVFTFPLLKGNPNTALATPFSIVLTRETAARYFGTMDPLGQTLVIDNEYSFTVTGVLQDIPSNTHLRFDMLLSMATREAASPGWLDGWDWSAYTYVQLAPGGNEVSLQQKFPQFVSRHTGSKMWERDQHDLILQPLTAIHLHSIRTGESGSPGSLSNLYFFSFITIFILLIACINFVNLTTALAVRRAREIGMRKAIGGTRMQLVLQFLSESVLLSLLASFLAIGFCDLLLPFFQTLSGIPVVLKSIVTPLQVVIYFSIVLTIGCLAGSYPAILLSGLRTVSVLNGWHKGSPQGSSLRKGLIVLQFTISMVMIAGTIIVFTQLRYIQQHDLGYDGDPVLVLSFGDDSDVQQHIDAIKGGLLSNPDIDRIATSSHVPGKRPREIRTTMKTEGGMIRTADMCVLAVDYDFIPFYGILLTAGRGFSLLYVNDATEAFMINEAAAAQLGFLHPEEITGKQLSLGEQKGTIIGVVKDFHYESLHKRIEPLLIRMRNQSLSYFSMRIQTKTIANTLDDLEKKWYTLAPHRPFDFFFLDDHLDQQYRADSQFGKMFGVFAFIAITLACLGLLGLTSFTVQQRTKEIGIRKVLGASVTRVVALLSKDLIRLVLVSVVIAAPFEWYIMNLWLQNFAYRITIQTWMFLLAGGLVLLIAVLTVSFQSFKAAIANPIDSLRNE